MTTVRPRATPGKPRAPLPLPRSLREDHAGRQRGGTLPAQAGPPFVEIDGDKVEAVGAPQQRAHPPSEGRDLVRLEVYLEHAELKPEPILRQHPRQLRAAARM